MTIVEDGAKEIFHELKTTITWYPHQGYADVNGDDFWHEDQGWDRNNPKSAEVVIQESPFPMLATTDDKTMGKAGESNSAGIEVWTLTDVFDEGDLLEWADDEWYVENEIRREVAGNFFANEVTAKLHEG